MGAEVNVSSVFHIMHISYVMHISFREGVQKNRFFLGLSPKLWVGGGQES